MTADAENAAELPLPGGNFQLFVQKLAIQALFGLGVVENPLTGEKSVNLDNARMVLDDLEMLRERTRGNLSEDEERHLDEVLAGLHARLAEVSEAST